MGHSCSTLVKRTFSPVIGLVELVGGALLALGPLEERLRELRRRVVLVRIGDAPGSPSPGVSSETLPHAPPWISRWFHGSFGM